MLIDGSDLVTDGLDDATVKRQLCKSRPQRV